MGIRDRPTAPRSPWQNAYIERLIGSVRRDCLDHLIIVDERYLRALLRDCAEYYNRLRTHLSLNKDARLGRRVQHHKVLCQLPHFGGPHHSFVRMWFLVGTTSFSWYSPSAMRAKSISHALISWQPRMSRQARSLRSPNTSSRARVTPIGSPWNHPRTLAGDLGYIAGYKFARRSR